MKRKKRLTKTQKKALAVRFRFWAAHAGHWLMGAVFIAVTFGLVYTFWANDAVFAAAVLGS